MNEQQTVWAVSIDGETWTGGHTREGAINEGSERAHEAGQTTFQIGVAVPIDASCFPPCAGDVLEAATERVQNEVWTEFEGFDTTASDELALQVMLNHAFWAWVEVCSISDVGFQVEGEETWTSSDDGESFHPEEFGPAEDCPMCEGLPPVVVGGVIQHCEGCQPEEAGS